MSDDGLTYPAEAMRQACAEAARLRAENDWLWGEVSALIIDIGRAREELRQGRPKLARSANRTAIEQWNRADAAEAEAERLRAKVAAVEALLLKWEELTDPLCADCYDDLRAALASEKGNDHAAE